MTINRRTYRVCALALVVFSLLDSRVPAAVGSGANTFEWRASNNHVSARIQAWTLHQVLVKIATTAGWEVFVEPDIDTVITAEFKDLTVSEALGRLLGELNFALLPQTGAPAKLFVYRSTVQEATEKIKPPPLSPGEKLAKGKIPNELIVTLKPGSREKIEDLAKRLGAKVVGRIDGVNAYRLQFADASAADTARQTLSGDSDVASVDSNYSIVPPSRIDPLAVSSPLPLNLKPNQTPDPNRVVIGLVDTAVQAQSARIKDYLLPGISVASDSGSAAADSPTHGTAMAETILRGISMTSTSAEGTTARILPVDVYGGNESTSTFDVANGVYTAIKNGATVVNLSLGSDGDSPLLHQMIQEGHAQGVVFVAAAGNTPTTDPTYPAVYTEVIATTAGDKKGNLAAYANRGSFVDVVAPGGSVINFNGLSYLVTGTSAATAYVSGVAAGLAGSSGKPPSQVENQIRSSMSFAPVVKP